MSVNPSLPWDGRWGASVSGAHSTFYSFLFQDGVNNWTRDDGVLLTETDPVNTTISLVSTAGDSPGNDLGPAGYAMVIEESVPDAYWDDPIAYGMVMTPRFPVKPGDIVDSRLMIIMDDTGGLDTYATIGSTYLTLYDATRAAIPAGDTANWYNSYCQSNLASGYAYSMNTPFERMSVWRNVAWGTPNTVLDSATVVYADAVEGSFEYVMRGRSITDQGLADLPYRMRILGAYVTVTTPGGV